MVLKEQQVLKAHKVLKVLEVQVQAVHPVSQVQVVLQVFLV